MARPPTTTPLFNISRDLHNVSFGLTIKWFFSLPMERVRSMFPNLKNSSHDLVIILTAAVTYRWPAWNVTLLTVTAALGPGDGRNATCPGLSRRGAEPPSARGLPELPSGFLLSTVSSRTFFAPSVYFANAAAVLSSPFLFRSASFQFEVPQAGPGCRRHGLARTPVPARAASFPCGEGGRGRPVEA